MVLIGSLAGWAALYPIAIKFERFVIRAEMLEFGIWDAIACFCSSEGPERFPLRGSNEYGTIPEHRP
jgi:hypothetical protein